MTCQSIASAAFGESLCLSEIQCLAVNTGFLPELLSPPVLGPEDDQGLAPLLSLHFLF